MKEKLEKAKEADDAERKRRIIAEKGYKNLKENPVQVEQLRQKSEDARAIAELVVKGLQLEASKLRDSNTKHKESEVRLSDELLLCQKQVKDVHEIQKVQGIFEAKEAEISKTKSWKDSMVVIEVEEKQVGVQGDSATETAEGREVGLDTEETKV